MSADTTTRTTRRSFIAGASILAVTLQQANQVLAQSSQSASTAKTKQHSAAATKTMRALFAGGGGPPHFRSVPTPRLQSDVEAIVRPLSVALCDIDVAYLAKLLPTERPYAVGHEFTAEVVEIGSAVQSLTPGDRVIVPFQISCGTCSRCRSARSVDCSRVEPLSAFGLEPFGCGSKWGGALADFVRIPFADAMAVKLPLGADVVALASLSDNVADAYRCIAPHARAGDEALVIGSASIGLYAVAVAAALGVSCTYVDSVDSRIKVAERLGAKVVSSVPDGKSFGEFPVVASCNSSPGGLLSAIRSTSGGGICQTAGIHFRPVDLPLVEMYRRGIKLMIGRPSVRDHLPDILQLIQQKRLKLAEIGATVIDFEDAPPLLQGPLSHKTIIKMV